MVTALFVVVADSTRATTYTLARPLGRLVKHSSVQSPAAHQHERDLGSDRPGRVGNRAGGVRHALQSRHTLKQLATTKFQRSLAKSISARLHATDESLILVAAPRMLGALKAGLSKKTLARLHCQLPRDLVDVPPQVLQRKVRTAAANARRRSGA